MRRPLLVLLPFAILLPALVAAHPPAADPHNSCLVDKGVSGPPTPPVLVSGTHSYLAPAGTSLPCAPTFEWGSHAKACAGGGGVVGPVPGAYCGPIVPAGGTATCTWTPVVNTVPTRLVIGFDVTFNGLVRHVEGEKMVFGGPAPPGFPPGSWTVPNPYGVAAPVIAFPTAIGPFPPGLTAPNDQNLVICVTP